MHLLGWRPVQQRHLVLLLWFTGVLFSSLHYRSRNSACQQLGFLPLPLNSFLKPQMYSLKLGNMEETHKDTGTAWINTKGADSADTSELPPSQNCNNHFGSLIFSQVPVRAGKQPSSDRWGSSTDEASQRRRGGALPNASSRTFSQPWRPWQEPWPFSKYPTSTPRTRYEARPRNAPPPPPTGWRSVSTVALVRTVRF